MIGMSAVRAGQFISLNAVGALVWAIVVGTAGYLFGEALKVFMDNIRHYELEAAL
jgi:membrane protein DedA with SNARE-associated domain